MSEFVYNFVLSDAFLLFVLALSFFFVSQKAIREKMIKSYAAGWLLGILMIISIGALMGRSPDEVNNPGTQEPVSLSIFQVMLPIFLGFLVSGVGMAASYFWRDAGLRRALQTVGYTALFVVLFFLMFIASTGIRYMIGIFALTLVLVLLFGNIFKEHLYQTPRRPPEEQAPVVQEIEAQQQQASAARNRVQSIREQMRRERQ